MNKKIKIKDILKDIYEQKINEAIKIEDYETAAKIKKILENLNAVKN
jgi:protein-arginine kinase activator protein McsA